MRDRQDGPHDRVREVDVTDWILVGLLAVVALTGTALVVLTVKEIRR